MPRERMKPGTWGKITVREIGPDKFVASTYARGRDGRRRQPERIGKSEEDARRKLLEHLQKSSTPPKASGAAITERTSLAQLFDAVRGAVGCPRDAVRAVNLPGGGCLPYDDGRGARWTRAIGCRNEW